MLPYGIYLVLIAVTLATPYAAELPVATGVTRFVLECLALVFSLVAARHPGLDHRQRRPWRYVAAALVALLAFEITLAATLLGVQQTWATTLVIGLGRPVFLVLILISYYLFAGPQRRSAAQRWRLVLDALTVVAGSGMWIWYFILGPALSRLEVQPITAWQAVSDIVGHLIVIFAVSVVLMRGSTTSARTPLVLLLSAALISLVVSLDSLNATLNQGRPEGDHMLAIAAPIPPMLVASAAIEQCRLAAMGEQFRNRVLAPPIWLPYAGAGIGFITLGVAAARAMPYPWWGLVAGAAVTTIVVMSRQFLALRDIDRLVARDSVTGLASRTKLLNRLGQLVQSESQIGVTLLQIDLDGFKRVNDEFGHEVGDAYLAAFGTLLRNSVRPGDLAARVGGDEFTVLLTGAPSVRQSIAVAERILQEARRRTDIAGHSLSIPASIGIGVCDRDLDVDQMMRQADLAMYVAKRRGSHDWELYSEATTEHEQGR